MTRGLSLRDVSRRSGVHYVTVSGILTGRVVQPTNFAKIEAAIAACPPLNPYMSFDEFSQYLREFRETDPTEPLSISKAGGSLATGAVKIEDFA